MDEIGVVRDKLKALLCDAEERERVDAQQNKGVARASFKSVSNNLRRALSRLDELDADLVRVNRDRELTKLEK